MTPPAGVCRFCGCSTVPSGKCWTDLTRTVCMVCAPAAKAEVVAMRTVAKAGYRSDCPRLKDTLDFVATFHQGFVVGWFGISARRPSGRNPWPPMRRWAMKREAWDLGQRSGEEASRAYQRICGPIVNAPRREVLRNERRRRSGGAHSKHSTTQVPRR